MKFVKEIECRIGELSLVNQEFIIQLINHLASHDEDYQRGLIQGIAYVKKRHLSKVTLIQGIREAKKESK